MLLYVIVCGLIPLLGVIAYPCGLLAVIFLGSNKFKSYKHTAAAVLAWILFFPLFFPFVVGVAFIVLLGWRISLFWESWKKLNSRRKDYWGRKLKAD
jgi:hypothetical protein